MKITVNGAAVEVEGDEVSYALVQRIAFNGKADRCHSITFDGAAPPKTEGTLAPGESVRVAEGTVFNVYVAAPAGPRE